MTTDTGWKGEAAAGIPGPDRRNGTGPLIALVGCGSGGDALAAALADFGVRTEVLAAHHPGADDLARLEELEPDTVVVGPALYGEVRELLPRAASSAGRRGGLTLALTASRDPDRVGALLDAGVDDVVPPPHSAASVLLRRRVLRHRRAGPPERPTRIRFGSLEIDPETREVSTGGPRVHLSQRELDLLLRLAHRKGGAAHREELIREVWLELDATGSALDATVHRLRRRLEGRGLSPSIVQTVRGVGYRLAPELFDD